MSAAYYAAFSELKQRLMNGELDANDLVSLSAEASVVADIRAPRVVIEDGARFKGRIEMEVILPPGV